MNTDVEGAVPPPASGAGVEEKTLKPSPFSKKAFSWRYPSKKEPKNEEEKKEPDAMVPYHTLFRCIWVQCVDRDWILTKVGACIV
jgi:hypothetical protein